MIRIDGEDADADADVVWITTWRDDKDEDAFGIGTWGEDEDGDVVEDDADGDGGPWYWSS